MTTFYFVRHGLTDHTGQRLSGWQPGVHLSEAGRAQAEAVADRLAEAPLVAVYASPIDRTLETARPIAERHKLKVIVRDGLGEVHYGRWTNRSFKSLRRTKLWEVVQRWPSAARFPEGESIRELQARAMTEVEMIASAHTRRAVCVVSHADVIRVVLAHYLGVHLDLFQRIEISPASVSVVDVGEFGPRVLAMNAS
ncbi:MAG: MSMEG_4193 family putative phosphomutase [Actinomycetota bacterium]